MTKIAALVVVATPIGNLADLSQRAATELQNADAVVCEDTRRTGRLFELAGLTDGEHPRPKFIRCDEHRQDEVADSVVQLIQDGARVVLVTDSGMPGISDPGVPVVQRAIDSGCVVEVVPGASAVLTALVLSGFDASRFVFEGFLPRKGNERQRRLDSLSTEERTTVIFEAPQRLGDTLADLAKACSPDRLVAVCRELTKLHEEVWRGTLSDAVDWSKDKSIRGELVLVIGPPVGDLSATDEQIAFALADCLERGMSKSEAAAAVARKLQVRKRDVYDLAIKSRPVAGDSD